MKFFNRASLALFLISSAAIFCLGWISDWQVPASANETMTHQDRQARAYYNRGTAYYKEEKFGSAIRYLSMALALQPQAPDAYFNRGLSFRHQHKIDEAISDFSKAIELYQGNPGYYFERGNARILKNDLEGAISDSSKAAELSPKEADGYFLRGVAHFLRNDLEEALRDSAKALQIDPEYTDAQQLFFETLIRMDAERQKMLLPVPQPPIFENHIEGAFSSVKT